MDYDGWVMKRPDWNYIDLRSFRLKRSECIKDFRAVMPRHSWVQLRRQGWRCVKVKLIEVDE